MEHGFGESCKFGARHAAPQNGHQPCGNLVIRDVVVRSAFNEKINFFAGQLDGIAFFTDDVNSAHSLESSARLAFCRN